tara:strand:- start:6906 stop:7133 length:228 start_codon:yes stop_codon:yes gene_type:complete
MDKEFIKNLGKQLENGVKGLKALTLELTQKIDPEANPEGKYIAEDVDKLFSSIKNNDIEAINELNKKYNGGRVNK